MIAWSRALCRYIWVMLPYNHEGEIAILLYGDEKDEAYETCYNIWLNIYAVLNKEIVVRNENQ